MDLAAALRAFVRTVERGSITSAARDLGLSQPAVTKQLKNLEAHVGARLLERSTKIVRPTPLGQSLYESSRSALATINSAVEGVRRDMGTVQGLLRVHAPSCIGAKHLHPIVAAFQELHSGVTVDLFLEDRRVDIVYDNFDVALKYGKPDGQDLIVRRVGHVRRILVGFSRISEATRRGTKFAPVGGNSVDHDGSRVHASRRSYRHAGRSGHGG